MKQIPLTSNFSKWLSLIISLFIWSTSFSLFADEGHNITIPSTLPAVWKAIDEHGTSIEQAIKKNQLKLIHVHAFAIRDLANALPSLSGNLSGEQKTNMQDTLNYISQVAIRLDKTGDANDNEGTVANWKKLKKLLNQLHDIH